ncbi:MAG: translocation/assembly module TamB domain-containing protein [Bdellovibrionales bacterium]|nr:translocation/assembly module TamB domain-containing protein [Bdellovibrionales bacterium]
MSGGIRQLRKRPFLIFAIISGSLLLSALIFIQSKRFADLIKGNLAGYIPGDLGVIGDFSEFEISFLPPGISILNPELKLGEKNLLNLPTGSSVKAGRLDLLFYPLQMLTGRLRVHEIVIADGAVHLRIDPEELRQRRKPARPGLSWNQLFQARADAVSLERIDLDVEVTDPKIIARVRVDRLRIGQARSGEGQGYEVDVELRGLEGQYPTGWKAPSRLERAMLSAFVSEKGVDIAQAEVVTEGLAANVKGKLKGDVLSPKRLLLSSETRIQGDLAQSLKLLAIDADVAGRFSYEGRLSADLMDVAKTLGLHGKLTAGDVRYGPWYADSVEVEGRTETEGDFANSVIRVERVLLGSADRERNGGRQAARGGKVEFKPFSFRPSLQDPVEVEATLEGAHIHWLAAGALKDVYPMDFRVSGPIGVRFLPEAAGRPWEARAELGFEIPRFILDNQRLGKDRKLNTLLDVRDLRLLGGVRIQPGGITPDGLALALPRTRFAVGGAIGHGKGYALDIEGPVDLQDFGMLSEREIRGKGTLRTKVTGPSSRVFIDFEPKIENAFYLGLNLGDIQKGNLVWDDGPGDLLFREVQVQRGVTDYSIQGKLELGIPVEKGALDVQIPRGNIADFIGIFENLTKDLWWFPASLSGPLQGKLALRGGLSLDALDISADLEGKDWLFYTEKFRKVSLTGGYRRGTYFIERGDLQKNEGRIVGGISFDDPNQQLDWSMETVGVTLADFDHLQRLDLPLKGALSVVSRGRGKVGSVESATQASLNRLSVRGVSYLNSRLGLATKSGVLLANGDLLGGQGTLDLSYDFTEGKPSHLRGELRRLDFTPVLMLINSRLMGDKSLAGRISAKLDLDFKTGKAELASGTFEFTEYLLSRSGAQFSLAAPASAKIEAGTFTLPPIGLKGHSSEATLTLASRKAQLEGGIRGKIDLAVAELLTSVVQKAEGAMDLDFRIGGSLKEPRISGRAAIAGGSVRTRSVDSPFESLQGLFELEQNVIHVRRLAAELAGGDVDLKGQIELFASRFPTLALEAAINNSKLQVYPFQYARVRGKIRAGGEALPYLVDGQIRVLSALSRENVLNSDRSGGGLKVARYTPPPISAQDSDYPLFRLDIRAQADEGILVKNDLFDAELKADVTLVNTLETPRLTGSSEVIRGRLIFKDQSFVIQSGKIEFDNPLVIDPKFNMTAGAEVRGVKVQMFAAGRLSDWKLQLSSNPVMPETDIIQLLAQGVSPDQMARLRSGDRTVLQQKDAASLLLQALDFNRDVKDKTGLEIQLDEAVSNQLGSSITRRSTETDAGGVAAPKIVIKRQVSKNIDISVGSTVGVGSGSQQELNAEVKVAPGVSVIGVWNTSEGANSQDNQTSFGVDLKVQKRFK